ncbi:MAG: hypothetical protein C0621_01550 [Desulfuromonas sp.]|nr:MAG: hypothetical protein C0621_01550 [Desulfuromonas sp.]
MFLHGLPQNPNLAAPVAAGKVDLTPLGHDLYTLKLQGKFAPRWLANLTSGLSTRNISINRGSAMKMTHTLWEGNFEIVSPDDPSRLDILALTGNERNTPKAPEIRLQRFHLEARRDDLYVEVEGSDTLGFLVALFNRFTFFSLFPSEVRIDTFSDQAQDRFWLKGLGGSAPSPESCDGLRLELEKLCV